MKHALAILALAVAGFSLPAPAAAGPTPHMRFGMVGVVLGQTARLNVVVDSPDLTNPPNPDRTCAVELMFLDAMGNVLARSMESLMPGHAAFLDFMNGRVAPAPGIDNPDLPPRPAAPTARRGERNRQPQHPQWPARRLRRPHRDAGGLQ